jgi:signal transduction histidine kinase
MDMAIKWRNNLRDNLKSFGREFAAKAGSPEHTLAILAAALVFFCIELLIEQCLFDNDLIVDILGAATGVLAILLLRFAVANARLYRELRANSETLERRVSEIAHEFQTPIAILKGNLAILAEPPPAPGERASVFEAAATTLDRLSRLVRTLLDVAKLHAPQRALARETIDANALVGEICEDCARIAEDRGIMLGFVEANEPAVITADRDQLKEVLLNLVGNALKYTARGGSISIEIGRRSNSIEIAVADTGCGIAPENLPHVFQRFYRIAGDDEDGAPISGTGLGLYLSKQIIEAHGGTVTAESEVGRGSRFIVRLPAAR